MQDKLVPTQAQPFMKLVQANMELLTRFSTSPEVTSQAANTASNFYQQSTASAMALAKSGAFAQMMQGMLKNYTEFLTELSQSGMQMMSEGQAALTRQAEKAIKD